MSGGILSPDLPFESQNALMRDDYRHLNDQNAMSGGPIVSKKLTVLPTVSPIQNQLINRFHYQLNEHGDASLSDENLHGRGGIPAAAIERFHHWIRENLGIIDIFLKHGLTLDARNDILRNAKAQWLAQQMRRNFEMYSEY